MKQFYLLCIVSFLFLSSVESYAQVKDPDGSETVTPRGVRPVGMQSESGSVRAVIIGISDYKEIDDLKYAARDAEIFYDYLVSNAGGNIDSARIDLLTNEQANFGNIWKSFERLKAESVAGDKVIIYFSGHGDVETLTDAQNGYLLTYNTNKNVYPLGGFPLSMLSHYLITLSNMDVQVIFIGDACRSGKLAGGMDGAMQTNALLKMQWANEIKILSCQPGELSMESATCGGGRGIFSYHLVQGLYGLADENGDGDVTLAELQIYLLKKVPPASPFPQNPVVTGNFITSLARVDTQSLLALREKQSVYENYIASLEPRGQIGGFLEELEPEKKRIYLHFRKFIEEGNLITPAHACALEAFTRMTKMDVNESIIKMMQRNLAAALQNEAQDVISNYVNSIIPVVGEEEYFMLAATKMDVVVDLMGADHPFTNSYKAKQLFLEARSLVRSKDLKKLELALQKLMESSALESPRTYTHNTFGMIYTELGQMQKAIKSYEKASELAPRWSFPLYNLGKIYEERQEFEKARKYFERAIEIDPENPSPFSNMGNIYNYTGQLDKAKEYYHKAIAVDSGYVDAFINLAVLYEDVGETDLALEFYQKALEADSNSFNVYYYLAILHTKLNDRENAIIGFKKCLEIDSTSAQVYFLLGDIYFNLGQLAEAIEYYIASVAMDTNFVEAYNNLGVIHNNLANYEEAVFYYRKTLELAPDSKDTYFNLGNALYYLEEYSEAVDNYKATLDIDPNDPKAIGNIAQAYRILGQCDVAIGYYDKLIELEYQTWETYNWLGYCYLELDDFENAIEIYRELVRKYPDQPAGYYNLACVYSRQSKGNLALIWLEKTFKKGYEDLEYLYSDPDLDNIKKSTEFHQLIEKYFPNENPPR